MSKYLIFIIKIVFLITFDLAGCQKVFRIIPKSQSHLELLNKFKDDKDYSFWIRPSVIKNPVDVMVASEKINEFIHFMNTSGIQFESLIENVSLLLASSRSNDNSNLLVNAHTFEWDTYHKLEEIYAWLDSLPERHPNNVEIIIGGSTYEGREIKGVKLSFGESKPGVFIEGGIHAREWITPATVTYLINQLLTNNDTEIRKLAESHDWYIFPVFNPDGYAFTHIHPTNISYREWRKTRSLNQFSKCIGADMNRNWGIRWMTIGTSNDSCSAIYGGSGPFSEIESKTLSQYITSISDKLFAYIAFHSYSQYLMFPNGYTKSPVDNYEHLLNIGTKAVKALSKKHGTEYKVGAVNELVGLTSGSSVDWVKSEFKLPLVYVYELRDKGNTGGFLLPEDQIIPNCEEVMDSLVTIFQSYHDNYRSA